MEELKRIIAKNIADLRTKEKLTQAELAARLSYSDKAVSKWERGESIPDVAVLKQIADLFSVTVDYLLTPEHDTKKDAPTIGKKRRHFVIAALSAALVWLIATVLFVISGIFLPGLPGAWLLFLYAVPVSSVVLLIFNSLWGNRRWNYAIISLLTWSLLLSLFLSFPAKGSWMLFLLGVPAEIIILLWSRMSK